MSIVYRLVYLLSLAGALGFAQGAGARYSCPGISDIIVQLFGWRYDDIKDHCQQLANAGVCAIQIDPPHEHMYARGYQTETTWFQRWRPVSYKLDKTDAGQLFAFEQMLSMCNGYGVRVYADIVMNHMTNVAPYTSVGSAGNWYDSTSKNYPQVPYTEAEFHVSGVGSNDCPTPTNNIEDPNDLCQLRFCRLQHAFEEDWVHDLSTENTVVQGHIRNYLNLLIEKGVSGFRISHARYIPPEDIQAILSGLQGNPFIYLDVGDFGNGPVENGDYTNIGRVEEVRAGERLTNMFRNQNGWSLSNITNWNGGLESAENSIIVIDDEVIRRNGYQRGTDRVASWRSRTEYETLTALLLALPKSGYPKIHSGYSWPEFWTPNGYDVNWEMGPPDLDKPPVLTSDGCEHDSHGYVCEHWWLPIKNMIIFHDIANNINASIENVWTNNHQQVAFSRGEGMGFVAINNDFNDFQERLYTGMEPGIYCDLMTGPEVNCTNPGMRTVQVGSDGYANIFIPAFTANPMIAIRKLYGPLDDE